MLVPTEDYVDIMQLKYDKSAEESFYQLKHKEYALPWAVDRRSVIAIGINYSSEKRRIDGWLSERL